MSGWDWDGLARSIDMLNSAISQEVRVGDARVVILNRDSARLVRDAAEAWVRDYGRPTNRATLDGILAWLDEAPEDWPWTGQDVADMIRAGCPDWRSPGADTPKVGGLEVVEWLEQGSNLTVGEAVAKVIRAHFGLPHRTPKPSGLNDEIPVMTVAHWEAMGLKPGDVCNTQGDLLQDDGSVCPSGFRYVTEEQAARASVFGWERQQPVSITGWTGYPYKTVRVER